MKVQTTFTIDEQLLEKVRKAAKESDMTQGEIFELGARMLVDYKGGYKQMSDLFKMAAHQVRENWEVSQAKLKKV